MLFDSMSQYMLVKAGSNPELGSVGPPIDFSLLRNYSDVGSVRSKLKFFLGLPLPLPREVTYAGLVPAGST